MGIQQVHGPAPVRQVEDSEDEAACQPTLQIHGLTPVRQVEDSENEAACQPIQQVHGPAPVRHVEDSEDEAVHQPIQHGSVVEEKVATQQVPCTQQPEIAIQLLPQHRQTHYPHQEKVVNKPVRTAQPVQ